MDRGGGLEAVRSILEYLIAIVVILRGQVLPSSVSGNKLIKPLDNGSWSSSSSS